MPRATARVDVPMSVWADPRMRAALDRRDVGTVLRLVAGHTGCSQHRLAAAIDVPQGRISEYIAGRRRPNLDTVAHIADGLGMPECARQQLGLAGDGPSDLQVPTGTSPRELLKMAEHLGRDNAHWRPPLQADHDGDAEAWLRLDHVLRGHDHVDLATIAHLNAQTRGLWQMSDQLPARAVMPAIVAHAENIANLLCGSMPDELRQQLIIAVGQASGIAACCAADLGHHVAVAAQLRTAQTAAYESGDSALRSLVVEFHSQARSRQGHHRQALDILAAAENQPSGTSPAIAAYFRLRRAEEQTSINGRPDARTLAQAADADPSSIDDNHGWARLWARSACLEAVQAGILAHNAAPDEAVHHAAHAEAELNSPASKSDAVAVSNLAATYALLGDTQRSCRAARSAFITARETEAVGCLARLEALAANLMRTTHDPEAKALRHDIITAQYQIRDTGDCRE